MQLFWIKAFRVAEAVPVSPSSMGCFLHKDRPPWSGKEDISWRRLKIGDAAKLLTTSAYFHTLHV